MLPNPVLIHCQNIEQCNGSATASSISSQVRQRFGGGPGEKLTSPRARMGYCCRGFSINTSSTRENNLSVRNIRYPNLSYKRILSAFLLPVNSSKRFADGNAASIADSNRIHHSRGYARMISPFRGMSKNTLDSRPL